MLGRKKGDFESKKKNRGGPKKGEAKKLLQE